MLLCPLSAGSRNGIVVVVVVVDVVVAAAVGEACQQRPCLVRVRIRV